MHGLVAKIQTANVMRRFRTMDRGDIAFGGGVAGEGETPSPIPTVYPMLCEQEDLVAGEGETPSPVPTPMAIFDRNPCMVCTNEETMP
jgi:hypothetical protein